MRFFENKEPIRRLAVFGVFLLIIAACACLKQGVKGDGGRGVAAAGPQKARNWKVTVGPHPCAIGDDENAGNSAPTQVIVKNKHTITWKTDAGEKLHIVFHVDPDCPVPFADPNLVDLGILDAQGNKLWLLTDDGHGNISVKALATACACPSTTPADCQTVIPGSPQNWQIKYDQYVVSAKGKVPISCDGWIIIQP